MHAIWDQLALSEPQWESHTDAENFFVYRDNMRVMEFLIALHTDYEPIRASLLHREKFPKLESVVAELLSKETRLGILKTHKSEIMLPNAVLATSSSFEKFCKYWR